MPPSLAIYCQSKDIMSCCCRYCCCCFYLIFMKIISCKVDNVLSYRIINEEYEFSNKMQRFKNQLWAGTVGTVLSAELPIGYHHTCT